MMNIRKITAIIFSVVLTTLSFQYIFSHSRESLIWGDINDDGEFTIADVVLLKSRLLGEKSPEAFWESADICQDSVIDTFDMCMIRKLLTEKPENTTFDTTEIPIHSSYVLYCIDDRKILYSDHINDQIAPASLTKLLTAATVLRSISPETVITAGTELKLVHTGSSLCLIAPNHRIKVRDLLTGMLIASGNDAAYSLSVAAAREYFSDETLSDEEAVSRFTDMMNQLAAEIGMTHSHFTNPDGWDDPQQYTTSKDLLILARYACSIPEIREICALSDKKVTIESGEVFNWSNSNSLLAPNSPYYHSNATGMKTGTTENAGCCLIGTYNFDGKEYISIVTGCESNADRFDLTLKLIEELEESP